MADMYPEDDLSNAILAMVDGGGSPARGADDGYRGSGSSGHRKASRRAHSDEDDDNDDDDADGAGHRSSRRGRASRRHYDDDDDDSESDRGAPRGGGGNEDDEVDTWGPDLIGNSRDREWLESLPMLERERILSDRADKRQAVEERRQLQNKLRELNRHSGGDAASAGSGSDTRPDKKRRLEALVDKRDEKRRRKGDGSGSSDSRRRKRQYDDDSDSEYDDGPRARKPAANDDSDDDNGGRYACGRASYDSDDEPDRRDRRAGSGRRSRSRSPEWSRRRSPPPRNLDSSPDTRRRSPARAPAVPFTLAEARGMQLTRNHVETWCYATFFEELAQDTLVRVRVGDQGGVPVYRIGQVVDVSKYKRIYTIQSVKTNKAFSLKHGQAERTFLADVFSNQPFTENEFERWRLTCENESTPLPTHETAAAKKKAIATATAYIFSDAEVRAMLKARSEVGAAPRNVVNEKAELLRKRDAAMSSGDTEALAEIEAKLAALQEMLEARTAAAGAVGGAAMANKRNVKGAARAYTGAPIIKFAPAAVTAAAMQRNTAASLVALGRVDTLQDSLAPNAYLPSQSIDADEPADTGMSVHDLFASGPKLDIDIDIDI
ncbi:RNA polymerase-associated protein rtf1 [Blastocladiella emersonii ATCC 22665]|nr:RNA polymerase-associated protein rtf1 [Blastocladiella emersonii ATCC 22665]